MTFMNGVPICYSDLRFQKFYTHFLGYYGDKQKKFSQKFFQFVTCLTYTKNVFKISLIGYVCDIYQKFLFQKFEKCSYRNKPKNV